MLLCDSTASPLGEIHNTQLTSAPPSAALAAFLPAAAILRFVLISFRWNKIIFPAKTTRLNSEYATLTIMAGYAGGQEI